MPHETVDGKVRRLHVNTDSCSIRLDQHGDRYFKLPHTHDNYFSIYSLLVAAAVNRYTINLRLEDYKPTEPPSSIVLSMTVDWPA